MFACRAALAVDHRVCFRSLHAAEFQRQSAAAAAAAAAVAGFSAFNLHSSSLAGADRRYCMSNGPLSKSTQRASLACYRVTGNDVGQMGGVAYRRSPADGTAAARCLRVAPDNGEDDAVVRRTYPQ